MIKRTIITVMILVFMMAFTGCGITEDASVQNTSQSVQNEIVDEPTQEEQKQIETEQTELPDKEQVSTVDPMDLADTQESVTTFESDYGYSISYDEEKFDYRRTEGYDEFIFKSDEADRPFVFVCISHVGAEFVETVKEAALGTSQETCIIGREKTEAECGVTEEEWEGGKVIHKTCVCPLGSGDALLIEMQWYTEGTNDAYSLLLQEMVDGLGISK